MMTVALILAMMACLTALSLPFLRSTHRNPPPKTRRPSGGIGATKPATPNPIPPGQRRGRPVCKYCGTAAKPRGGACSSCGATAPTSTPTDPGETLAKRIIANVWKDLEKI